MSFFDIFWVPQEEVPNPIILIILSLYHVFGMIIIFWLYHLSNEQIKHSISGPSPEAKIVYPNYFIKNIKLSYYGLFLIIIGNFLSHFLSIVFRDRNEYFGVGGRSIITFIGGFLFFYSSMSYQNASFRKEKEIDLDNSSREILIAISSIVIIFLTFIYIFRDKIRIYLSIFLLFYWILLVRVIIKQRSNQKLYLLDNPLKRLRVTLFKLTYYITVTILFIAIVIYFPSDDGQGRAQTSEIEYLIFFGDLYSIIAAIIINMTVNVPRWLRKRFHISDKDFYNSRDARTDYKWYKIDRQVPSVDTEQLTIENINGNNNTFNKYKYSIFYDFPHCDITDKTKSENQFSISIKRMGSFFNVNELYTMNNIDDEYVKKYIFTEENLVFISSEGDSDKFESLRILKEKYWYDIKYNKTLSIGEFTYNDPSLRFGFISVIPSLLSGKLRIWTIIGSEEIYKVLADFVKDFGEYIELLSKTKIIIMIIRFSFKDGVAVPIPHSIGNPGYPSNKHVELL